MKYIKFWSQMFLIPLYIIIFFIMEFKNSIPRLIWELNEGIQDTKRKYNI